MQISKILVPIDFSENSKAAVAHGCELARQFKAELHLLNIVDNNIGNYSIEMGMVGVSNYAFDAVEAEKRAAERIQQEPGPVGHDCTIIRSTQIGPPCPEIVDYANAQNIDLIVISTHGYTGLTHFLLGSVAENIVRTAPCPVLTVRPEAHQIVETDGATDATTT